MGIFHSPVKTIGLMLNSTSIAKKIKPHDADWYFSDEGAQAYAKAATPAQKTKYFYDYLLALTNNGKNKETLFKIAYIMANSVAGSSVHFGEYPDILKSTRNPLINCVKTKNMSGDNTVNGILLLAALHYELEVNKFSRYEEKPYLFLSYANADCSVSDFYKIERYIIGAFCTEFSSDYVMPPYLYDIIKSANARGEDQAEDEEED